MNLHENKRLFADAVLAASEQLGMSPVYVEKDYWVTRSLKFIAKSSIAGDVVLKGETSLSKGYKIGKRFSEDIDIAVCNSNITTGNRLKTLMKKIAKEMTFGMEETDLPGVTSKGSRYYKAIYTYPNVLGKAGSRAENIGQLMVKVNGFSNPRQYVSKDIECFIGVFLRTIGNKDIIENYGLEPFALNILDKRQTLIEKLAALVRFSFSDNYIYDIAARIRHFYDLHYLLQDEGCANYLQSKQFKVDFNSLLEHDRETFDKPDGWSTMDIKQSPLLSDFHTVWSSLKGTYLKELPAIAFSEIPSENEVAKSFEEIIKSIL